MHVAAYPGDLVAHLRALVVLAEQVARSPRRAFPEASRALRVDVSVLRRRMTTLSRHLGAALVAGRGDALRLTEDGARFAADAARVLADLERLGATAPPPALRVGCTGSVATELLPRAFVAVRRRDPAVALSVRRAGAELARRLLVRGELDFAIARGEDAADAAGGEDLDARDLGPDRLWLAVPAGDALARGDLDLAKIAARPLVSYAPTSYTRRRVMARLAPLGAAVTLEVDGKAAALEYVRHAFGVALVSVVPGQRLRVPGVVLRDVTRHFPATRFWALWRAGRTLRPWERAFVRELGARRP